MAEKKDNFKVLITVLQTAEKAMSP